MFPGYLPALFVWDSMAFKYDLSAFPNGGPWISEDLKTSGDRVPGFEYRFEKGGTKVVHSIHIL